jgi:16S rRNA (uracil1498-N3)-methyltransferase
VTAPVFFHADASSAGRGDRLSLDGDEGRHAADVRRLRAGESLDLTDGAGTLLRTTVTAVRRGGLDVEVVDRTEAAPPAPRLVAVQALARGGRDEAAVEAMTEVGVDEVIGWQAARSVARWTDRTHDRWTATTIAAAKQSRRAWWPGVGGPATVADVAGRCRSADLALVLHEAAGEPLAGLVVPVAGEVVVVVGPEGGVTDDELATLHDAGGHVVRLGATVLRSSTAGVAALSVVCAATRWRMRGDVPRS